MRTDLFDFELPAERIAQAPAHPKESAKLLHISNDLMDRTVADLPDLLQPGDLLVLNDTRVLPTRFAAHRGVVSVDVTLVQTIDDRSWWAFAKPGRKLRTGDEINLADGLVANVADKLADGRVRLDFNLSGQDLIELIKATGHMPLPPYIRRPRGGRPDDDSDYQTVFARHDGSVAAPTASLHLTQALLDALDAKAVGRAFVTLHVGMGTFLPVKTDTTDAHVMHREWFDIPTETATKVNETRARGGRIVAVGTTVIRTLESAARDGRLVPESGDTQLFIHPGFRFQLVDLLLTNFHLPRSTLFMLVSAFAGLEKMQAAYAHAIETNYRFFSYGDACLLERQ